MKRFAMKIFHPLCIVFGAMLMLATPDVAAQTAVQTQWQGKQLNAGLVLKDGGKISDDIILITHGTLGHNAMETIRSFQTALKERGYNSLAITLSLGISNRAGMYDCSVPHRHRHTGALQEIQVWIDWLKSKGVQSVTLMGHSRGGNQTAWFASENKDPIVKKVVLLAPMIWNKDRAKTAYEKSNGVPLSEPLEQATALIEAGRGDELMENTGILYCKNATVSANSFVSYYAPDPRFDTPSFLPKIRVPVLVIAGSEDTIVKGLIEAVRPLADGRKISLKVIDGSDHFFLDFYAEDGADAIDEFSG